MTMWFAKSTKGYLWPRCKSCKKRGEESIDKDNDGYIYSEDKSSSVNGMDRKTVSKDIDE